MTTSPSKRELYPYQDDAVLYAHRRRHPALFMEMRLGKTLVIIRWVQRLSNARRIIVVAPLTVHKSWIDELEREGEHYILLNGTPKKRIAACYEQPLERCWWIISYGSLLYSSEIASVIETEAERGPAYEWAACSCSDWDVAVLDESTMIRTPGAKRTQICVIGFRSVLHRAVLSGLPDPEGPLNFFTQFQFLHNGMLGCRNFWAFRARWFTPDSQRWDWTPKKRTRKAIQLYLSENAFTLSRQEAGIGSPKVYERRYVEMTPAQKKAHVTVRDLFMTKIDGKTVVTQWAMVRWMWMHRIAGGMSADGSTILSKRKIQEIIALASGELKGYPTVVYFNFRKEIDATMEALQLAGVSCEKMDGDTKPMTRHKLIDGFREGAFSHFLVQSKLGIGIDLSRSSTVIRYSNTLSCEATVQAEDRIVHPEKKEPLLYIDLITEGTMDSDVVDLLGDKKIEAKDFLNLLWIRMREGAA